jgi:hypothetical protein
LLVDVTFSVPLYVPGLSPAVLIAALTVPGVVDVEVPLAGEPLSQLCVDVADHVVAMMLRFEMMTGADVPEELRLTAIDRLFLSSESDGEIAK